MTSDDRTLLSAALAVAEAGNLPEKTCAERLLFAYDVAFTSRHAALVAMLGAYEVLAQCRPAIRSTLEQLRIINVRRLGCRVAESRSDVINLQHWLATTEGID